MDFSSNSETAWGNVPTADPPATSPPVQTQPPPGPVTYGPPAPVAPTPASGSPHMAAVAFVSSLTGAALGASRYGVKGGAVGFLLVGSAFNLARALRNKSDPDPVRQDEALWSGIYAVAGIGAGSWFAYQLYQKK